MPHAGGRPTIYSQEIVEKTKEYYLKYFTAEPTIEVTVFDKEGKETKVTKQNPLSYNPPYIEELSLILDIDTDTIVEWCKQEDKKEFSVTIKRIKILQKLRLLHSTMEKNSATGSIFQLKVNHGMVETNRQELTGKDGEKLIGFNYLPPDVNNSNNQTNT